MSLGEIIDTLVQEAILLDPRNLQACGKMLTLLDSINDPVFKEPKNRLKSYLEALIMNDIDGHAPESSAVVEAVTDLQNRFRALNDTSDDSGTDTGTQKNVSEHEPAAEETASTEPLADEAEDFGESEEGEIEDPSLLQDFITEAFEHLESIELNMVEWEKSPNGKEIINSIFRPFHTIKGVAGFLNLQKINHLSHQLENLLDEAREGRINLSNDLSDLIFDGVDILKSMITSVESHLKTNQPIRYEVNIESFIQRLSMFLNTAAVSGDDGLTGEESIKPTPMGEILVKEGKLDENTLQETLEKQASMGGGAKLGELLVKNKAVSARDVRDAIRKQVEPAKHEEKSIKVDTLKMDQLLDTVGELVISQTMVTQNQEVLKISDQRLVRDLSQLQRVTSTLQSISMSMRLVPIGATFQKMNRIVRDLARKSGKKINLVLEGQNAEIDRNMVEELYDPLVHMVRNSCDHGIQDPDERIRLGKPAEGTILLKAEHAGGKIVISISDDGNGLNREKILAKGREKGLVRDGDHLEEKEIFNLIFMPGFSTAEQVTSVSGRGVGMDVVRKSIEKLRGTVEILSAQGKGTTFSIKLPLTTAIIDGLLVMVGDDRYIIPTLSVRRLVKPEECEINRIMGKAETVMVRGRLLPLVRMHEILGTNGADKESFSSVLVIVEDNGKEVALEVDKLLGKQEVVIKSLGERFRDLKGVAGGTILGDGKVGLILDVRSIIGAGNKIVGAF